VEIWVTMLDNVLRIRRSSRMFQQLQQKILSLIHSLRECAFTSSLLVVTPSSIIWGDIFEDDLLTHSSDSEGAQTEFPWTPSAGVTGPPRTSSVSELSKQRVGAGASEHQILMRRRDKAPQRLEPHLAIETCRSSSISTSGGRYLARGQADDLGEMSRSRYSW
jgi:hypothetical protein